MIPFGRSIAYPEARAGRAFKQAQPGALVAHVAAWFVASAVLLLVGWSVAKTLGSPLLSIVASGMLFLTGVSLRSAVEPRHP